jgi:hypothetical protein
MSATGKPASKNAKNNIRVKRRDLLKSAAATAGLLILPSGTFAGAAAPSNKLNIALIGADGRARAHYDGISGENVVAICDVDEEHLDFAGNVFPKAKRYIDWRECLDHPGLDAIVCCTTDQTHAFIANWAMLRDLHVYMEKPLAISVEEARVVRATYMKKKDKLATQVGMQRHAKENFNRVRELIMDGAIGELRDVSAWGDRQIPKPGYLPDAGPAPKNLHYDLWLGPAPYHPYNPGYFAGNPGVNCLSWNMYWDFGCGQIGDMGSHTMDLAWNAIDAEIPTSATGVGEPYNPEVTPVRMTSTFEHPANDWRPAITMKWYQGGDMPESPSKYVDLNQTGHGAMFQGTHGALVANFDTRVLIPNGNAADLSYYKPRVEKDLIPAMGNFQQEWIDACKGDLKTSCDFDYSGDMIEQLLLGLVAYRHGDKIEYDAKAGRVTNSESANQFLSRPYRDGWSLVG